MSAETQPVLVNAERSLGATLRIEALLLAAADKTKVCGDWLAFSRISETISGNGSGRRQLAR
jgi:hypothetical protein